MRTKKSIINSSVNIITYMGILVPNLVVRRVFLNTLGEELLGVNSLFNNIIGLLSIVELGVGNAIVFSLYKPFAENDRVKVKGYLDFYLKLYRIIGNVVLVLGICLIPFLKYFMNGQVIGIDIIICYLLYLTNTYITYRFSYKSCILNVAQEEFKISIGTAISKILMVILQILLLYIIPSFNIYLIVQLITTLLYFLVLNIYIDKQYEWLKSIRGEISQNEKKELSTNIKALFIHKIGSFVVESTDNLLISYFINLSTVAKFGSYNVIISACKNIINKGISGITASIGNLLVSDKNNTAYLVHKRIFFISFWVTSFICISLYNTLDQFIILWIGESQLLNHFTLVILIINLYFTCMRGSVERFQEGSGNFVKDRYAPIFESIINLTSSIILVKYIGLPGIFIGTLISNIMVIFWTKPLIVYKYIFNRSVLDYYKMYFKHLFISIIPLLITNFLTRNINIGIVSISSFLINCIINIIVINIVYIVIFIKNEEFKYFKNIITKIIKIKKTNDNLDQNAS